MFLKDSLFLHSIINEDRFDRLQPLEKMAKIKRMTFDVFVMFLPRTRQI